MMVQRQSADDNSVPFDDSGVSDQAIKHILRSQGTEKLWFSIEPALLWYSIGCRKLQAMVNKCRESRTVTNTNGLDANSYKLDGSGDSCQSREKCQKTHKRRQRHVGYLYKRYHHYLLHRSHSFNLVDIAKAISVQSLNHVLIVAHSGNSDSKGTLLVHWELEE